jgi:Transglycosylase SLT domain
VRGVLLALVVCALAAGGALAVLGVLSGDDEPPSYGPVTLDPDRPDPFAWDAQREEEFIARATAGHSHVLYEKSPGGVFATARRVERWRPQVEDIAGEAGVDADVLEGMVFLESAGDPNARASEDLEGAVGLTQILAETATSFLGMRVDVRASERLTRKIQRSGPVPRLLARRREVDERFDPQKALEAAGRYLETANERFGREDLAVASYHMGIGNLDTVLAAFEDENASWAQIYFDATPRNHPRTHSLLSGFGDDSATYLWRVYAARAIMRLYREDHAELRRLNALHTAKASAEEVLHPRTQTAIFETPGELEEGYSAGELRPLQGIPGLRADPKMGGLARRMDVERRLYRGLRPAAYALAAYLSAGVRDVAATKASLTATSSVRDLSYQRLLARRNAFATREYSLHTTGFALDIRRDYASRSQAVAFEYMLDRLQSLNLLAWIREPAAIHITASGEARELLPLLEGAQAQ